jgi:hypothetical protein
MNETATTLTGGRHGTKWLGALTAVSGILQGIDPTAIPPNWLPYITGFLGLATVVRGVVNSSNQSQGTPR